LVYGYDAASNPTYKLNAQRGASARTAWTGRDWTYTHDKLDRLTLARRGVLSGTTTTSTIPTITQAAGSQKWTPDVMGNWSSFAIDLDNNGDATGSSGYDATAETQIRHHNKANELQSDASGTPAAVAQPTLASGVNAFLSAPLAAPLAYDHDDNGSRTKIDRVDSGGAGVSSKLVYDAWNRLVAIKRATVTSGTPGTYGTVARYEYNGLHWRTAKTAYSTPGGSTGTHRFFTYNAAWQCILEEVDDDYGVTGDPPVHAGIDRAVQQVFGLRGVNDALYRREDRYWYTAAWIETPIVGEDPETFEPIYGEPINHPAVYHEPDGFFDNQAFYQLSDPQFSVVSVVAASSTAPGTTSGTIVADGLERPGPGGPFAPVVGRTMEVNEYDPYGRGNRWAWSDFDRDGTTAVGDIFEYLNAWFASSAQADSDEDGTIETEDIFTALNLWFASDPTPRDGLTAASIDNPYGYCGYYADLETLGINGNSNGFLYQCRYRVYDPISGRWLTRDPAGFVDGFNLYMYYGFDPFGLDTSKKQQYQPAPCEGPLGQDTGANGRQNMAPGDAQVSEEVAKRTGEIAGQHGVEMKDAAVEVAKGVGEAGLTAGSFVAEPLDWISTAWEIIKAPTSPYSYAGLLPLVPSGAGRGLKAAVNATDAIEDASKVAKTADRASDAGKAAGSVERINGRYPINSKYAGKVYPAEKLPEHLRTKYSDGVRFKETGHPDFTPYSKAEVEIEGLTGHYDTDADMANKAVGLKQTPDGYTWHHVEDAKTMQLVPQDLHYAVRHTGGAAVLKGAN
jgi:RHS repeat-associated protein